MRPSKTFRCAGISQIPPPPWKSGEAHTARLEVSQDGAFIKPSRRLSKPSASSIPHSKSAEWISRGGWDIPIGHCITASSKSPAATRSAGSLRFLSHLTWLGSDSSGQETVVAVSKTLQENTLCLAAVCQGEVQTSLLATRQDATDVSADNWGAKRCKVLRKDMT